MNTTAPVLETEARVRARRGRGPLAAALLYVGAWAAGLAIPSPAGRSSGDPAVAAAALSEAFPLPIVQASLVHGVAGVALLMLVTRSLTTMGIAGSRRARQMRLLAWVAASLSLAQFAGLVIASGFAPLEARTAHSVLAIIDLLDVAKISVIAVLAVLLPLAYRSAGGSAEWILPSSIALAVLLLVGASNFVAPTDATSLVLAASLIALLAWTIAFATLAAKTHRHG